MSDSELLLKLAHLMYLALDNSPEQNHNDDLLWEVFRELNNWKVKNEHS